MRADSQGNNSLKSSSCLVSRLDLSVGERSELMMV